MTCSSAASWAARSRSSLRSSCSSCSRERRAAPTRHTHPCASLITSDPASRDGRRHALSAHAHFPPPTNHLPPFHLAGARRSRRALGPPAGPQMEAAAAGQAAEERARAAGRRREPPRRRQLSVCRDRRGGGARLPAATLAGRAHVARAGCRRIRGADRCPQRRGDGTRGAGGAVR